MLIALDVFGGDNAPTATINGAKLALENNEAVKKYDLCICLVGNDEKIRQEYSGKIPDAIEIFSVRNPAISSSEDSAEKVKSEFSSIQTALRLHREGKFDGVVSAGSTGSQVISSLMELEKCYGITRPAIGAFLPTSTGHCFLLDVGASLSANAHHLVQFAAMGRVYVREALGIDEPTIGVLNVGQESKTGDRITVEAHRLLSDSGFNFIGFVEGRDILAGVANVVVTNGFTGNVLLKFAEGFPNMLKSFPSVHGAPAIWKSIEERFDYHNFGGEPLLGVKGVSIICHGASGEKAIAAAIIQAARMAEDKLHEKIETFLIDKFTSYFSQVKYLRSFRRSFKFAEKSQTETE